MKWEITAQPENPPVSYDLAASHIRLVDDEERDLVLSYLETASAYVEDWTQRSLITRTIKATFYWTFNAFGNHPVYGHAQYDRRSFDLELPRGPVQSIVSVTTNGVTVDPSLYELRRIGTTDMLSLKSWVWPVEITYLAGYGDDPEDVPPAMRQAALMLRRLRASVPQDKALQDSGDLMGAQKIILDELSNEFGGAAEAIGDTFSGQVTKAKNALGDTVEVMVGVFAPAIGSVAKAIKGAAEWTKAHVDSITSIGRVVAVTVGAFIAYKAAMVAWTLATREAAFAQALLTALSGPKGWAQLAIALAAAAAAG